MPTQKVRKPAAPKISEHQHQASLFSWAWLARGVYPELKYMFAVPNAAKRSPRLAAHMKAEGLKSGVPDVVLPVGRCGYSGLFIEMKTAGGSLTPGQIEWCDGLAALGNKTAVCWSFDQARELIEAYLGERL